MVRTNQAISGSTSDGDAPLDHGAGGDAPATYRWERTGPFDNHGFHTWQLSKKEGVQITFLPYVITFDGKKYMLHNDEFNPISDEQVTTWFLDPEIFVMEHLL